MRNREQRGRIYYGHYLAALSFFLGFTSGAVYLYSRGVLLRDQIVDFHASRTEMSLAFALVEGVATAFAPALGYLLDRYPVRNVMAIGALWLGAGFLAMSQASSVAQFAIVTALSIGLGTGCIGTTANSKLMVSWFDRHRGLALAVAVTGYSLAGIVMAPVAVFLLDRLGWRHTYILFGCVCLFVVLPVVAALVRQPGEKTGAASGATGERPRARSGSGRPARWLAAYRSIARSPRFWAAVFVFGVMGGVFGGLNLHLFLHYIDLGLSDYEAATILALMSALGLASKPVFGRLIDRWGARTATVVATCACMTAMVVFAAVSTYPWLLVAGALFGLAFGGLLPLRAAVLSRLFDTAEFGRADGSLRLATFPLTFIGSPLIGLIYDARASYTPAFIVFAVLFAAAALTARRLQAPGMARCGSARVRRERAGNGPGCHAAGAE